MWRKIQVNLNQIKTETSKAFLINCPNNSTYSGYSFWHPAKLVKDDNRNNMLSVIFTEEFQFKLSKYGNGKYNRYKILEEIIIDSDDMLNLFEAQNENNSLTTYLKVVEPKKINKEVTIPKCLKIKS